MTRRSSGLAAAIAAIAVTAAGGGRTRAECAQPLDTKTVPLPVWATSPNEGSTWGVMPVFVHVCPEDQRTQWILAPGLTWNSVIHYTGTLRLYAYPDADTAFTVVASASTRINYNLLAVWQRLPAAEGAWTDEATLRVQRTAFARFFGQGPATAASAESSYTSSRAFVTARRGRNLGGSINVGLSAGLEYDGVDDQGVPGLPLAPDMFPGTPGMRGAALAWQGLDVRYDDRCGGDYAEQGVRVEGSAAVVEGIARSPTFLRFGAQARGVWRELAWLSGAARAAWTAVSDARAPFYQQSQLGGSFLLRGFEEGRFTDRQAWTVEAEQRIRLLQTTMFGVVTDWRLDPFLAAGQVFGSAGSALAHAQIAAGVGLRAFVRPNVVGRIDVATAGEGMKVYVEIGYPY